MATSVAGPPITSGALDAAGVVVIVGGVGAGVVVGVTAAAGMAPGSIPAAASIW